ncbi:hypothetical protein GOV12_06775 [Candidatus Pacearchaeota archaeon]|nr:hypothetical protein [Candidatus Pacearchaeota archaeon]
MLLELTLAITLGIIAGTITGLFPGIHNNLVSVFILSISGTLLTITSPIILIIFIISLAITHTFVDFIPSVYLGAPNDETNLSVLPGHQMLMAGYGHVAIFLSVYGGLISLLILLILTPIFILILPTIYPYVKSIMPHLLILTSVFLLTSEKKNKKLLALFIFLFAGILGFASLNSQVNEPLLPLFSGLFGISSLIISLQNKSKVPIQQTPNRKEINFSKKSIAKTTLGTLIATPFTAFLPGLGASQAAVIGKEVIGDLDKREFIFLLGGINTLVMALSFIGFYSINKTRTGAADAISKLIESLTISQLFLIILTIILTGFIAAVITLKISKIIAKYIQKINYTIISYSIIILLIIVTFIFSGPLGLLILISASTLGILTIELGVRRMNLMGSLLIPTILYYIL